jgi:hypothetical protein
MYKILLAAAAALAASTPILAVAQTSSAESPKAVPQLSYRSTFADYKPWEDSKPGDWKALNDAVGKSAGHAMDMPMGGASAPVPGNSKPAMADHGGNHKPVAGGKQ